MNSVSAPTLPAAALPQVVHDAIDAIVQRAKIDQAGVYWPLGMAYRAAEGPGLALSLGYGTPGVLLTLLEYHRWTGDRETAELLHKGLAWVRHRSRTGSFTHGLYGGTPGLWYLYHRCDREFPGGAEPWREAAVQGLRQGTSEHAAGVALGAAGTILATLACLDLDARELAELVGPLRDRMLGSAGLTEHGLFWDHNATSLRPPLGFVFGNAGIEYTLAQVGLRLQERYTSILLGSLNRARSEFNVEQNNWPDFDAMSEFRSADQAAVDRILDRVERGERVGDTPEYSLGWGSGAAGILLGRVALASAFGDDPVGRMARDDAASALNCLEAATPAAWEAMDASIQNGLAGVMLAVQAVAYRGFPLGEPLRRCAAHCREQLQHRAPTVQNDDVSLLTGVAGAAYALLMADSHSGGCVDLLDRGSAGAVPNEATDLNPRTVLSLRMPACAELDAYQAGWRDRPVTLGAIREQIQAAQHPAADLSARRRRYELEVQETLAGTNFRQRFWAETVARRRFARFFAEGMEDNVLFARFRLDDSVALLDLDFDPRGRAPTAPGEALHILRQPASRGLLEARLSPLQAALLREFGQEAVALKVIHDVVERVQTPNVTQRQLATLALKMIRAFVSGGQLVPIPTGSIARWLIRRKLQAVRQNLFPLATE